MKAVKGSFRSWMTLLLIAATASMVLSSEDVAAREQDRVRFTGWVESMPEGLHGTWIIGGQEITTTPRTEFDQMEGPLAIGGCAKVDIRGGQVHEIDSEPPSNCL